MEKEIDDEDDQQNSDNEVFDHIVDRHIDIDGRIVGNRVADPVGEAALELLHHFTNRLPDLQCITSGQLIDTDQSGGLAVEDGVPVILFGTQFDLRHITQIDQGAVLFILDDDLPELFDLREPSFGGQDIFDLLITVSGRRPDFSDGSLFVLRLDGGDDISRREVDRPDPVGIEPDAHRVLLLSHILRFADTGDTLEFIEDIDIDIVAQEFVVVTLVPVDRHETDGTGTLLVDDDAGLLDFGGE